MLANSLRMMYWPEGTWASLCTVFVKKLGGGGGDGGGGGGAQFVNRRLERAHVRVGYKTQDERNQAAAEGHTPPLHLSCVSWASGSGAPPAGWVCATIPRGN